MRAAVNRNRRIVVGDVSVPAPAEGQVLARTLCCGICGSDLHTVHPLDQAVEGDVRPAFVLGHEFVAEILEYGPATRRRLREGARVVSVPIARGANGFETIGLSPNFPGGFGEALVLNEATLIEVPSHLSDEQAALTEPLAVGEHAVAMSAVGRDTINLVVGCGPVGLAVIAALKARGLGPVIACDYSAARRGLAERLGADMVFDPSEQSSHLQWSHWGVRESRDPQSVVQPTVRTGKRVVAFECVGKPGVLQGLIASLPDGSQILVAGVCGGTDHLEPSQAIMKQIGLQFVLGYTVEEFAGALDNIAEGRIDVTPLITSTVTLEGVADAFEALREPDRECKIIVRP